MSPHAAVPIVPSFPSLADLCPGGCSAAPRFERVLAGELYFWASTAPSRG